MAEAGNDRCLGEHNRTASRGDPLLTSHIRHPRSIALPALAALSLALVAAGPASAAPNSTPAPKKDCSVRLEGPGGGQSVTYPHNYSFSATDTDGTKHTYKCNDGKWEETVTLTGSPGTTGGVYQVDSAGTLQLP